VKTRIGCKPASLLPQIFRFCMFSLVAFSITVPMSAVNAADHSQTNVSSLGLKKESALEKGSFEQVSRGRLGSQIVKIGIEPSEVYGVDLVSGRWSATFQMWWRWTGEIDPTRDTYFTNSVEAENDAITYDYVDSQGDPKALILSTGEKYQRAIVRVSFVKEFELKRFPLDRQFLQIRIENKRWQSHSLSYEFDTANLSVEENPNINGWSLAGTQLRSYIHHYKNDLGKVDEGIENQGYSQLVYSMEIKRSTSQFYLKYLFPLFIVLIGSYGALAVRGLAAKSPLAIASSGLLTTLFAQQIYAKDLPSQAPVVLMDKIYGVGLFTILMVFLRVVARTQAKAPNGKFDELLVFMGRKSDIYLSFIVLLVFVLLTSLLVLVE